jgi:hypothetical protein
MKYIIYKISIADYTYIGSTRHLKQRKIAHKTNCFNDKSPAHNLKLYQTIRANGGWEAIELGPIEEFECEGHVQAHIREEYWRREYDAQLNMKRAHRTIEECGQYNRDASKANRDRGRGRRRQYDAEKIQCECGATVCRSYKYDHLRTKRHADRLAEQQQNINV